METEQNGDHFLRLLKTETCRLNTLVCCTENDLNSDEETIPEDVRGKMRVAVGKAKMLLRNKFITFEKLCCENMGLTSDVRYPVTSEDLAGYWDTIVMQILQVYDIFDEVEASRRNNWTIKYDSTLSPADAKVASKTKQNGPDKTDGNRKNLTNSTNL